MTTIACTQPGCTGADPGRLLRHLRIARPPPPAGRRSAAPAGTPIGAAGGRLRPARLHRHDRRRVLRRLRLTRAAAAGARPTGRTASADLPAGVAQRRRPCSRASNRLASTALGSARAAAGGSKITRRLGTSSTRLRGARLGAGLTSIPAVPAVDAAQAILKNPMVPEDRRNCPVLRGAGRALPRRPARAHRGVLPQVPHPVLLRAQAAGRRPRRRAVRGGRRLAHGGLGWIYVARDRNVSDRWVVLKGLLNSGDPDALAAAIAERQFLAQVEHPLIVEIYNFVTHEGAGYIVMEYVGGTSLKQLLKERMQAAGGGYDPLPVDQAIAFVIEILPAFQYLHDLGLVYCDFKPDNIIQVGDAVKLIDLGGVRRLDDLDSAIYGTVGYQAPEVPARRAVGGLRHLHHRAHPGRARDGVPRLPEHLRRLAAAGRPTPLFQRTTRSTGCCSRPARPTRPTGSSPPTRCGCSCSACCARWSPLGREGAAEHSTSSLLFDVADGRRRRPRLAGPAHAAGRRERPAGAVAAHVSVEDPAPAAAALEGRPTIPEVLLAPAARRSRPAQPTWSTARADLLADDPWEWRAVWMPGPRRARPGDAADARRLQRGLRPGARRAGTQAGAGPGLRDQRRARRGRVALRHVCAHRRQLHRPGRVRPGPDPRGRGDSRGAVRALDLVPATSRAFTSARRRRAGLLAESGGTARPRRGDGDHRHPHHRADGPVRPSGRRAAGGAGRGGANGADPISIAGRPAAEPALRDGLESAYRELAAHAPSRAERIAPGRPGQRRTTMELR